MHPMHKGIPTSPEVWAVIRARHPDLVVHSGHSDPKDQHGTGRCTMRTSYALPGSDYPLIEVCSTWERAEGSYMCSNEQRYYWLCIPEIES